MMIYYPLTQLLCFTLIFPVRHLKPPVEGQEQLYKNRWHFYLYSWLLFVRWWLTFSISLPWKGIRSCVRKSLVLLFLLCRLSVVADPARLTVPVHNWPHSMWKKAISSGLRDILQRQDEKNSTLMVEVTIRGENRSVRARMMVPLFFTQPIFGMAKNCLNSKAPCGINWRGVHNVIFSITAGLWCLHNLHIH